MSMLRVNSGTKTPHIFLASVVSAQSLVVPESYAAGLKMYCPGGALFQTGLLKSPAHGHEQQPCQSDLTSQSKFNRMPLKRFRASADFGINPKCRHQD